MIHSSEPQTAAPSTSEPARHRLTWLVWPVAALGLLGLGAAIVPFVLRGHRVYREDLLRSAGPIETGRMQTDVAVDAVVGAASGSENAALFYVQALNNWNGRRLPYLQNRKLNPFTDEPMPDAFEIGRMHMGAAQRSCDFYAHRNDRPVMAFTVYPGPKPWPFDPASDPFAMRPYIGIMRLVAQGVLNAGKKLERAGNQTEAERDYETAVRFGWHLRQNPGSILDLQLGMELEQKGLHYLHIHYGLTKQIAKQRAVWRYGDSLKRFADSVERKFTQLGNPEAAMIVLQRDSETVWRVQAVAALKLALDVDRYGWLEQRHIRAAIAVGRRDPDRSVRLAVQILENRAPTPAAAPPPKEETTH